MQRMIPAVAAAVASGSSNLLGQGLNAWATAQQNKKSRKWQEMMYNRQRQDSLADWNMINNYNSPIEQMRRYKEAGLNPHLIYGQTNEAPAVRSTDVGNPQFDAPRFDLGSVARDSLDAYYSTQTKQQTIDNMQATGKLLAMQGVHEAFKIGQTIANTDSTNQSTSSRKLADMMKMELFPLIVDQAKATLDKTNVDTQVTLNRDEREAAMNASNLQEAVERILTMRKGRAKTDADINEINARINNINKDTRLKQLDINLREKGIMPGDPLYMRAIAQVIDGMDPAKAFEKVVGVPPVMESKNTKFFFGLPYRK